MTEISTSPEYVRDVFAPAADAALQANKRLDAALATMFPPSTPTRCALCPSIRPKQDMTRIAIHGIAAVDLCPACAHDDTITLADLRDAATRGAAALQTELGLE